MRILIILGIEPGAESQPAAEFDGLLEAYYRLSDGGLEVVVASPTGGSAWARSSQGGSGEGAVRRFRSDPRTREVLNDLLCLDAIHAEDFAAALCLGFGRFAWRADGPDRAGALIRELLALGRPVAVISPGEAFTIADAGEGLLIVGQTLDAPGLAASALLGVVQR